MELANTINSELEIIKDSIFSIRIISNKETYNIGICIQIILYSFIRNTHIVRVFRSLILCL